MSLALVPIRGSSVRVEAMNHTQDGRESPRTRSPSVPAFHGEKADPISHAKSRCEVLSSAGRRDRGESRFEIGLTAAGTVNECRETVLLHGSPAGSIKDEGPIGG